MDQPCDGLMHSNGGKTMTRDTWITVLLVIAGIVLAFVLFGAGVRWKSKTSAGRPYASIAAPAEQTDRNRAAARPNSEGTVPNTESAVPTSVASTVVINGRSISQQELEELVATYGAAPPAGRYWYDTASGMW